MITKLKITDNANTPLSYLPDVFENGFEVEFKSGVNIIVGENGCGKTTLMNLLKIYESRRIYQTKIHHNIQWWCKCGKIGWRK